MTKELVRAVGRIENACDDQVYAETHHDIWKSFFTTIQLPISAVTGPARRAGL